MSTGGPTLSEVARRAGVSVSTASQVYTGRRPVAKATRRKVLEAAAELGFRPGHGVPAVGIVIRPSEAVTGFAFGTATFSNLAGAVAVSCLNRGWSVFTARGAADVLGQVPRLDGCVVLYPDARDEALRALTRRGVPTVSLDPDPGAGTFRWWLGADYRLAVGRLLEHLVAGGARSTAVLVGQTDNAYRRSLLWTYSAAVTRRGQAPVQRVADNSEGPLSATAITADLLARPDPPDAIVTSSSVFAAGALAAAQDLGVDVPGRLMIATATDGPVAELSTPSITGLRIDVTAAANRLVDLLAERMTTDADLPSPDRLPLDLIVRDSTRR
ncbi:MULTISPECIES: LacI family DNA-binding transcriptional regulator [unclassified Saccharopolyspora]|uniref:LacI family DNA-binding transcriptional regulator n=1 Tax=unclassified Saccharopolyspora TaxID=2646250 RepID=UPI001CD6FB71|nr:MULTISPECIES: LacI family DNA-binding transcriptional regulator [unclassified Saccharopolyspora]MCA1184939.1 LacI family transcriptional regulator [Saccharopolyspora sp. 6T]MCA1225442.1 LacI family transcriptional regulator [Saccharopolyspora sp. 6M]MCA1279895.1 LacI family transcriptional regulator [Saccharopolyspora sp. 7B]